MDARKRNQAAKRRKQTFNINWYIGPRVQLCRLSNDGVHWDAFPPVTLRHAEPGAIGRAGWRVQALAVLSTIMTGCELQRHLAKVSGDDPSGHC